jgi:TonB family protein
MGAKQFIFAACFILGVSLILFQKPLLRFLTSSHEERVTLAVLSTGEAEARDAQQTTKSLSPSSAVHDQDTLTVGSEPARVKFSDGLEVELEPGSIAFFENTDRGIYVSLRTGNFKGIAKGLGGERVLFVKDGAVLDPLGRNIAQPPLKVRAAEESTPEKQAPATAVAVSEDTLTDAQISNAMTNLRQPLLKCYAGELKNNPESKGQVYLAFTIEPTGTVSLVKILQESFKNETLEKCIIDVVQRAIFDPFKGDPIVVNYPIYFE